MLSYIQSVLDFLGLILLIIIVINCYIKQYLYTEKRSDVTDLNLITHEGVDNFKTWEETNKCLLPNDLKNFYQLTNGFSLTWNYNLNDSTEIPLGKMSINCLSKLKRLLPMSKVPSSFKTSELYFNKDNGTEGCDVRFDDQHMLFELESCNGYGRVALVIKRPDLRSNFIASEPNSSVCFVDRSLTIHHLTTSFASYFTLMLAHLGLPEWHYAFTELGLTPRARLWIQMFCPARLKIDENQFIESYDEELGRESSSSGFDVKKVFKDNIEKKKFENNLMKTAKKKYSPPHAMNKN